MEDFMKKPRTYLILLALIAIQGGWHASAHGASNDKTDASAVLPGKAPPPTPNKEALLSAAIGTASVKPSVEPPAVPSFAVLKFGDIQWSVIKELAEDNSSYALCFAQPDNGPNAFSQYENVTIRLQGLRKTGPKGLVESFMIDLFAPINTKNFSEGIKFDDMPVTFQKNQRQRLSRLFSFSSVKSALQLTNNVTFAMDGNMMRVPSNELLQIVNKMDECAALKTK